MEYVMSLLVKLIDEYDNSVDNNPLIRFKGSNFISVEIDTKFRLRDDVIHMVDMLTLDTYLFIGSSRHYQQKPNYDIEIKNCYLEKPVYVSVYNFRGNYTPVIKFTNCVFGNNFINKEDVYFNLYENCEWGAAP